MIQVLIWWRDLLQWSDITLKLKFESLSPYHKEVALEEWIRVCSCWRMESQRSWPKRSISHFCETLRSECLYNQHLILDPSLLLAYRPRASLSLRWVCCLTPTYRARRVHYFRWSWLHKRWTCRGLCLKINHGGWENLNRRPFWNWNFWQFKQGVRNQIWRYCETEWKFFILTKAS